MTRQDADYIAKSHKPLSFFRIEMKNKLITTLVTTLLLTGCVIGNQMASYGNDAIVTLGNVGVKSGQQGGHISSVNGNVEVGNNSVVKSAETVNGNVKIGSNSQTSSLSTVNGNVEIGENTVVDGDASTVNGAIILEKGAQVKHNIKLTNGDVILKDNAKVLGNIVFEHTNYSGFLSSRSERTLEIAGSAMVRGKIILYTPVTLRLPKNFDRSKIDDRSARAK